MSGLGFEVKEPTPREWDHAPKLFAAVGAASVAGARGMAKAPFMRRPWAYPIAFGLGWAFGGVMRDWARWERVESFRLLAALREKDGKLENLPEARGRFRA